MDARLVGGATISTGGAEFGIEAYGRTQNAGVARKTRRDAAGTESEKIQCPAPGAYGTRPLHSASSALALA